jgi:diguanylate cyclase (GGDEF)-like protein/PAS domain S-box-containing protein
VVQRSQFPETYVAADLTDLFDAAPVSIIGVGRDGQITMWNRCAEKTFGWCPLEAVGMPSKLLFPFSHRGRYLESLQAWLSSDAEQLAAISPDAMAITRTGEVFAIQRTVSTTSSQETCLVLFVVDLREPQRQQKALLESRQLLENQRAMLETADARLVPEPVCTDQETLAILDATPVAVVGIDSEGRINRWNREAERIYGWPLVEAIGLPWVMLASKATHELFGNLLKKWMGSEPPAVRDAIPGKGMNRDGRDFPIELTVMRANSEGVIVFVRDLTDLRRQQTELRESRQRYQAILENIEDGYFEVDLSGKYQFVNEAFCKQVGYSEEDLLTETYKNFYDPETISQLHKAFVSVFETGTPLTLEYRITRKDGVQRIVEVSVCLKRDWKSRPVGFLGTRRDITDRKLVEKAIRANESRWRDLFEGASDCVYTCNLKARFTSINRAGELLTGYSREELLGQPASMLLTQQALAIDLGIQDDLRAGRLGSAYEIELVTKAGRPVLVELNISFLYESGQTVGILGIARDITARRRSERLDQGRASILEDVARGRPLIEVLTEVAGLVESELAGSACAIVCFGKNSCFEKREQRNYAPPRFVAARSLPEALRKLIDVSLRSELFRSAPDAGPIIAAVELATDPYWADGRDSALDNGWRSCWSAPVPSGKGEGSVRLLVFRRVHELPDREECNFLGKAAELASLSIEQRHLSDQLAFQATHDPLTGLPNRLLFEERLGQTIANARQNDGKAAVIWLDLDRFKNINDTLGHWVGDLLLQEVVKRFRTRFLDTDTFARMGGDEFAIVRSGGARTRLEAAVLAEALLADLHLPFPVSGNNLSVTASIGVAIFPDDGDDAPTLIRRADQAMYSAKGKDCGQFCLYSQEIGQAEAEKADTEASLRLALVHGGFEIHYQPQYDASGDLVGLEALLRYRHPERGFILPGKFIPVAEESGLIIPIGDWVLREVCRQAMDWVKRGFSPVRIAVNVSALQFSQTTFAERARQIMAETGMPGERLELELTETALMSNIGESIRQMEQLRTFGVSLAIDDFGTGYSSLHYLHRLKVDRLKIDRSFVADLGSEVNTLSLVQGIIAMARGLNQEVVAEGVETEEQVRLLRYAGCRIFQGYLFSRPLPAPRIEELFREIASRKPANQAAGFDEVVSLQLKSLRHHLEAAATDCQPRVPQRRAGDLRPTQPSPE